MPALPNLTDLKTIALFRELTTDQLAWLNRQLSLKDFPARYHLITVEEPGQVVYIILHGTVKIYVPQRDGREVTLAILGPGDTVGEMSLLDSVGRSANVVTMEKTTLLWMTRMDFWQCLQIMPSLTYELVQTICGRLRLANEQIQTLATQDVYGRVARQILAMAERYGQRRGETDILLPLRLTQSDLAHLVGTSRERVNQAMTLYKKKGYLSIDRRYRITIHDKLALARRCL